MNREEIAKKIKFDIANDLIVKNKDFIEADLSKVLAEIDAAEKRARREVALLAKQENGRTSCLTCGHNPLDKNDSSCDFCLAMDEIIFANSDHISAAVEMIGGK